jgi:S-formylglutathione hydrolase FrmB
MKKFAFLGLLAGNLLFSQSAFAFDVKNMTIPGSDIVKSLPATVVLPDGYADSNERFPTLYLLHGWSGDNTEWVSKTTLGSLADEHQMIVVMPNGAYDSWYVDSAVKKDSNYQSYIGKDVVKYIDKKFKTISKKEARAITGLSMGGYGALNVAINNPLTFGNVGSMSGGVDPRYFPKNWGMESVFGDHVKNSDYWDDKAIISNAHRFIFSGIDIIIDCGLDDFFSRSNKELHNLLVELKIPHDYIERPGTHDWNYWGNSIKFQTLFFSNKFDEKLNRK